MHMSNLIWVSTVCSGMTPKIKINIVNRILSLDLSFTNYRYIFLAILGSTSSGSSCSTQAHVDIPQPDLDISPAQKPVPSIYSLHETSGTEFQLPSTSFLQETSSTELQPPSTICPQETNSTEFQFPCNFSLEEACCTEFQFPNPCTLFEDLIPFEAAERQQTTVEPATPSRKRKLENEEENRYVRTAINKYWETIATDKSGMIFLSSWQLIVGTN